MRRKAKIDINQPEIVGYLRSIGCSVAPLHFVGRGFPDIVVGIAGKNYLLEIKNPDGDKKLTNDEAEWHAQWCGQVAIVSTITEALLAIGVIDA